MHCAWLWVSDPQHLAACVLIYRRLVYLELHGLIFELDQRTALEGHCPVRHCSDRRSSASLTSHARQQLQRPEAQVVMCEQLGQIQACPDKRR